VSASCRLDIKVTPNASRDQVVGWNGDILRIKVRSPALDGRANEAVCEFLSETLGLPRSGVALLRVATSRQKVIQISGLDGPAVRAKLAG
jgi:hypothetical protein